MCWTALSWVQRRRSQQLFFVSAICLSGQPTSWREPKKASLTVEYFQRKLWILRELFVFVYHHIYQRRAVELNGPAAQKCRTPLKYFTTEIPLISIMYGKRQCWEKAVEGTYRCDFLEKCFWSKMEILACFLQSSQFFLVLHGVQQPRKLVKHTCVLVQIKRHTFDTREYSPFYFRAMRENHTCICDDSGTVLREWVWILIGGIDCECMCVGLNERVCEPLQHQNSRAHVHANCI